MIPLTSGEELIRKTKPHSASSLSSPTFWVGLLLFLIGAIKGIVAFFDYIGFMLVGIGFGLMGLGYLRRVSAYTFYLTDQRIVSNYAFLRKANREISYAEMIDVMVDQGVFGKICGYADVWMYGYRNKWIVGRMRGVRLGDCRIIENKAWKNRDQ